MILTLSALLLAGMQTSEPVLIQTSWDGKQCTNHFDGTALAAEQFDGLARKWAQEDVVVRVSTDEPAIYRCIGSAIFMLQSAGVMRIDFPDRPGNGPLVHVLVPAGRCRVVVDGQATGFGAYRQLAKGWGKADRKIHFQPEPRTRYSCVDRALRVLVEERATNLGFTGNDQYASDEQK